MKKRNRNKSAVVRNSRSDAVSVDTDEYEYLCNSSESSEYAEIYELVKIREQTPLEEYLSHEEMLQKLEENDES